VKNLLSTHNIFRSKSEVSTLLSKMPQAATAMCKYCAFKGALQQQLCVRALLSKEPQEQL